MHPFATKYIITIQASKWCIIDITKMSGMSWIFRSFDPIIPEIFKCLINLHQATSVKYNLMIISHINQSSITTHTYFFYIQAQSTQCFQQELILQINVGCYSCCLQFM